METTSEVISRPKLEKLKESRATASRSKNAALVETLSSTRHLSPDKVNWHKRLHHRWLRTDIVAYCSDRLH